MNIKSVIKREFEFLKKAGFKLKIYALNTDYQFIYQKDNLSFEINYGLCYNGNQAIDKINYLNGAYFSVWINILYKNINSNIFKSKLFETEKLSELNKLIKKEDSPINQLKIYSNFIQSNILEEK